MRTLCRVRLGPKPIPSLPPTVSIYFFSGFFFRSQYNYKELCLYKLQPKTLSKLIKRLAKVYNLLDSDALPNVMKSKKYGQVQFLLYKNYIEKSLSKESWQEMVREIVPISASDDLKLDLVHGCSYHRDINEAVYWARYEWVCALFATFCLYFFLFLTSQIL